MLNKQRGHWQISFILFFLFPFLAYASLCVCSCVCLYTQVCMNICINRPELNLRCGSSRSIYLACLRVFHLAWSSLLLCARWLALIVNLPQARITWEKSPNEGLSKSCGSMGMSMGDCLECILIDVARPSTLWVALFLGVLNCVW